MRDQNEEEALSDESAPEPFRWDWPGNKPETVNAEPEPVAVPGVVPMQGPFRPHGRHVLDLHNRRVASCTDLPGQEAAATAFKIAEALNR